MRAFLIAHLGDGLAFQYRTDDWSTRGILSEAFPPLFALSTNLRAMVKECWGGAWSLTLAGALSDQRIEEFMVMQQSIVHKSLQRGVCDSWEWIGAPILCAGGYIRDYARGNLRRTIQSVVLVGFYGDKRSHSRCGYSVGFFFGKD